MNRYILILIVYIVVFPKSTIAQQHQNGYMYLYYDAAVGNYFNIDQEITPLQLANGTYWALTFGFNEVKDGGYIGIQTGYNNSSEGLLIFSIWNATVAAKGDANSYVVDFDGEGVGKSCRISIPLNINHTYRLRIWQMESNSSGTYWGAWIKDKTIGKEYFLGKIKTDQQTTLSSDVSNFVEYYGGIKPCDQVPQSRAQFNSVQFNCDDPSSACEASFNPYTYIFSHCISGTCTLNDTNSLVIFGGN
jgi:hypothetical protein